MIINSERWRDSSCRRSISNYGELLFGFIAGYKIMLIPIGVDRQTWYLHSMFFFLGVNYDYRIDQMSNCQSQSANQF